MAEKIPDTFDPQEFSKEKIRFKVFPITKSEQAAVQTPMGVALLTHQKIDVFGFLFTVHTNATHWFQKVPQIQDILSMVKLPPTAPWQVKPRIIELLEVGTIRFFENIDKGIFSVLVPEYCQQSEAQSLVYETLTTIKNLDEEGKLGKSNTRRSSKRAPPDSI